MSSKRGRPRKPKSQKARDALLKLPGFRKSDFLHEGRFDAVAQRRALRWFERIGGITRNPDFTTVRVTAPEKRKALKRAAEPRDLRAFRGPVVVVRTGRRLVKGQPDAPNRIRKVKTRKDGSVRLVLDRGEREIRPIDAERWAKNPQAELRRLAKNKPKGANRALRFNFGERFIGPSAEDEALIELAVTLQESLEDEIASVGRRSKRGRQLARYAKHAAAGLLEAIIFEIPSRAAKAARKRAQGSRKPKSKR